MIALGGSVNSCRLFLAFYSRSSVPVDELAWTDLSRQPLVSIQMIRISHTCGVDGLSMRWLGSRPLLNASPGMGIDVPSSYTTRHMDFGLCPGAANADEISLSVLKVTSLLSPARDFSMNTEMMADADRDVDMTDARMCFGGFSVLI